MIILRDKYFAEEDRDRRRKITNISIGAAMGLTGAGLGIHAHNSVKNTEKEIGATNEKLSGATKILDENKTKLRDLIKKDVADKAFLDAVKPQEATYNGLVEALGHAQDRALEANKKVQNIPVDPAELAKSHPDYQKHLDEFNRKMAEVGKMTDARFNEHLKVGERLKALKNLQQERKLTPEEESEFNKVYREFATFQHDETPRSLVHREFDRHQYDMGNEIRKKLIQESGRDAAEEALKKAQKAHDIFYEQYKPMQERARKIEQEQAARREVKNSLKEIIGNYEPEVAHMRDKLDMHNRNLSHYKNLRWILPTGAAAIGLSGIALNNQLNKKKRKN